MSRNTLQRDSGLDFFHPIIREWFLERLGEPSEPQRRSWPAIVEGRDVLVSAPTGSGKTLSAFMACLDQLFRRALDGTLEDETIVLYVSPLKALGNDIRKNLLGPLEELRDRAKEAGHAPPDIRVKVRSGDTPASERAAMVRRPPHILVTTPESFYLYLTSPKARETLRTVRTVIVDEIHALAGDKRGSHLALSLARLRALASTPLQLVGLSATQKPIHEIASFLTGHPVPEDWDDGADEPRAVARHKLRGVCDGTSVTPGESVESKKSGRPDSKRRPSQRSGSVRRHSSPSPRKTAPDSARSAGADVCHIVQVGHVRPWDLTVEVPDEPLSAVASGEMWGQVHDRLVALSEEHRTMLVFTNTRRDAERIAHDLGERIGAELVAAHHGSMSREMRLDAEERLKTGRLRIMVATASLELGIDVGAIELVVQIGSPRAISALLQRVGRSNHHGGGVSKGVLFALTRDELVECTALLRAVREGRLDAVLIPDKPLDILSQHVVAACSVEDWDEDELFELCRSAWPYRNLTRDEFDQVVTMLSEGVSERRGRSRVHLHRDRVHNRLRARRGARLVALSNGGAIPDTFTFPVIAEPDETVVGTLDEDFAVESMAGDVFVLGTTSWRVRRVTNGTVRVENAHGDAPTVPFWLGEAPARTFELSAEVASLREELVSRKDAASWLVDELRLSMSAADELVTYVKVSAASLRGIPTQRRVVLERFFDEAGGMQVVLHAPFGDRINRAWGLGLRKRFCRTFDFELQAAANDDGVLLSLGDQHSFPLADLFSFLTPENVQEVVEQAVLQSPLFGTRFRWNATRALALVRTVAGRRVPPYLQRARSDDLLAAVFPAQVGCQDNRQTDHVEIPDHPLVTSTMHDCLHEAMDIEGLRQILSDIRAGRIETVAVDLPEPSPLAHQLLNAAPYTFLDDAPLEERRARAVSLRRVLRPEDAVAYGALDSEAIAQVVSEAELSLRDVEEVHDALLQLGLTPADGLPATLLEALRKDGRAGMVHRDGRKDGAAKPGKSDESTRTSSTDRKEVLPTIPLAVAAERVPLALALFPDATLDPDLSPLPGDEPVTREEAMVRVIRGHMEIAGPVTATELAARLEFSPSEVNLALHSLESDGQVLRGRFRAEVDEAELPEWCDRRLLQRIHQLTVSRARAEVSPVSPADFMRFLFRRHGVDPDHHLRGRGGLLKVVSLLEGWEAPVSAWEPMLFASRMDDYGPDLLERACFAGEVAWGRLSRRNAPPEPGPRRGLRASPTVRPGRSALVSFFRRESLEWMLAAARKVVGTPGTPGRCDDGRDTDESDPIAALVGGLGDVELSHAARDVLSALHRRGALFFSDLVRESRRLPAEVENGLWECVARGLVTADAVENLRILQKGPPRSRHRAPRLSTMRGGPGRWSLLASPHDEETRKSATENVARLLLHRYGIVFRDLIQRESLAPPWRELVMVFRRMEARGEIRGGRFVSGFAGEQFALVEAVEAARAVRRDKKRGVRVRVAGVDPLNLTGVVTPGPRVPAIPGTWVEYEDGVPISGERQTNPESRRRRTVVEETG